MKLCKTCGETKPFDQFHKDRSKADGLNFYCKPCMIAKQHEYAARPPRRVDPEGQRTCDHCKTLKPLADYYADARRFDGLSRRCKTCQSAAHNHWRLNNLDKAAADQKRWRVENAERSADIDRKRNYGLEPGAYKQMLAAQGGVCAICAGGPTGRGGLHVDHCHDTGKVRGLLCHGCNVSIGHFKHDVDILASAIRYLSAEGG